MKFGCTLLRALLVIEALLLVPGLPAWKTPTGASPATLAYLLVLGIFSGLAAFTELKGKPTARIWAWGAAITNLPVYPALTPVGVLLAALLIVLEKGKQGGLPSLSWRRQATAAWIVWPTILAFSWLGAANVHYFAAGAGLPVSPSLLLFGGLLLVVPLCAATHQAGHRLAGASVGLTGVASWSGWADPQPAASDESRLDGRLLLWALGGPAASLVLAALMMAAFVVSPGSQLAELGELAGLASVSSLALFFVSLAPWKAGGYRSDGALLVTLMRRSAEHRRERALAILTGQWVSGARPRNWDPRRLRNAVAVPDRSRQHATACAMNYLYCLDHDYDSSTRYWIARLASEFAQDRQAVPVRWQLEIAYYLAAYDTSAHYGEAEHWRRSAGRGLGAPHGVLLRCEAALAISRGDVEGADALLGAAEREALGELSSATSAFELELLTRLRERFVCAAPAVQPASAAVPTPLRLVSFRAV